MPGGRILTPRQQAVTQHMLQCSSAIFAGPVMGRSTAPAHALTAATLPPSAHALSDAFASSVLSCCL